MTNIISAEEYTRPTLNVLMAISAELNRKKDTYIYRRYYPRKCIGRIMSIIVEHIVQFLLGGITWRPGYFPIVRFTDIPPEYIYDYICSV